MSKASDQAVVLQLPSQHGALVRLTVVLGGDPEGSCRSFSSVTTTCQEQDAEQGQEVWDSARLQDSISSLLSALPPEVADSVVPFTACKDSLQLVCHKQAVARLYKALHPLQKQLDFRLDSVRACINTQPLGMRQLEDLGYAAILRSLSSPPKTSPEAPAGPAAAESGAGTAAAAWLPLLPGRLLSPNILLTAPGQAATALLVELEVTAEQPDRLMLFTAKAGAVRYRLFSPMQCLLAEGKQLPAPLQPGDSDSSLVQDPAKLRAANRLLQDSPCRLLPDERAAFILSIRPPPTQQQQAALAAYWLGTHSLPLPPSPSPFLLEVATTPEADGGLLVPCCCVLSTMGLTPASPAASDFVAPGQALHQLLQAVCSSRLQLWGPGGIKVLGAQEAGATVAGAAAAGAAAAGGLPGWGSAAAAIPQFSCKAGWTTALDLQQAGPSEPLLLSELEDWSTAAAAAAAAAGPSRAGPAAAGSQNVHGGGGSAAGSDVADADLTEGAAQQQLLQAEGMDHIPGHHGEKPPVRKPRERQYSDFSSLRAYCQRKQAEQEQQQQLAGSTGMAASDTVSKLVSSSASAAASNSVAGKQKSKPAAGLHRKLPALSTPAAAGAAKPGSKAQQANPAAPSVLKKAAAGGVKRPAAAGKQGKAAAGSTKPPAAKKPKTAAKPAAGGKASAAAGAAPAGAAAAGGSGAPAAVSAVVVQLPAGAAAPGGTAAATPQLDAPAAPAAAAAAGPPSAASPALPAAAAAAAAAAAPAAAAPARKRTKASDLDLEAVTSKVTAAVAAAAAGGTASLKGVTVPEMQCYLKAHKLPVSGKKADLEARIIASLSAGGGAGVAAAGGG